MDNKTPETNEIELTEEMLKELASGKGEDENE